MTTLVCSSCGEVYKTRKWKPEMDEARCECGGSRVAPSQLSRPRTTNSDSVRTPGPRRRSKPLKRSEPRRDWSLAVAKKEEEGERCRVCGAYGVEAAHILGKKFDQPISPGAKTLLVLPDRIVPLCPDHHRAYDAKSLDLLGHLTAAEQAQAVLDAGSMGLALKRISPDAEMVA